MRGFIFATMFAVFAIVFWDDLEFRRMNIVLANIWCAASYIRWRAA